MAHGVDVRTDLRALLDATEAAPPVDAVEVLANELARMVGANDVSFLIADFTGDTLIRFLSASNGNPSIIGDDDADNLATVVLSGSQYEQALRSQDVCVEHSRESTRLYAPVTLRGDAIGVLELSLGARPSDDVISFVASAAHALAYVLIANRQHTDLFERGQRNAPFSLAAEIQSRLLPAAFTCEAVEFTVAGWLVPAANVGGDTFDYSDEKEVLHLSISDAKGHTVNAAQLATLAVSSLRNSRRSQAGVLEQAKAANAAIVDHAADEDFVSALLLRVELATGNVAAVNAGHPNPYIVQDGVVTEVALEPDLPFGMMRGTGYREQNVQLRSGDRLVLVTDGMLERNASSLDISSALTDAKAMHPRELVQVFARAVIEATDGNLEDDATILCLDWHGKRANDGGRIASAGASQRRAPADPDLRLD